MQASLSEQQKLFESVPSSLDMPNATAANLQRKYESTKLLKVRSSQDGRGDLMARYGNEFTVSGDGDQTVVSGTLFRKLDMDRVFVKFELDFANEECRFLFFTRLSSEPIEFVIQDIEDCESFDVRA